MSRPVPGEHAAMPVKRVRLVDVAREAGVSPGAVTHVLGSGTSTIRVSEETARRVRAAAEKLGFQPNVAAQSIRGKSACILAALTLDSSTPVEAKRLYHLERRAYEAGYQLMVIRSWMREADNMRNFLNHLRARQVDGLVVFSRISYRQLRENTNEEFAGFPSIFNSWASTSANEPGVLPDIAHGTRIAVDHLVARGKCRIGAHILAPNPARTDAWRKALRRHGLEPDPRFLFHWDPTAGHVPNVAATTAAAEAMIAAKVDAVIAENDLWAAGMLSTFARQGIRVPEDIAVIGYNNLDFAKLLNPALTTIDEEDDQQAEAMLERILALIGGKTADQIKIKPRLIIRESA